MYRKPVGLLFLLLIGCDSGARFHLPVLSGARAAALDVVAIAAAPVLGPGSVGEFDAVDVLNPSVLRGSDGKYWNLYSAFDGKTWHTGLAVSSDGVSWTKAGKVLSPEGVEGDYIAANGTGLVVDGEVLYWYQARRADPEIRLARSRDGKSFQKESEAVLRPGPYRSWDERGVADPYVIRAEGWFYLYYTGLDRAQRQQLGLARSRDGVHWEKSAANPVLELGDSKIEESGLGEPAVFDAGGAYWMLYTGRAWDEQRRLGLARSLDGVAWTRVPNWEMAGKDAWDSKVVCDPSVEVRADGTVRVWFGGGDVARPDEKLNGRIGLATLRLK